MKWKVAGAEAGRQEGGGEGSEHQDKHEAFTPDDKGDREGLMQGAKASDLSFTETLYLCVEGGSDRRDDKRHGGR